MPKRLAHLGDVMQGGVNPGWIVFPVRQQVDGDEVHRWRDFWVFEPELPDIGVGDRLFDLRLDLFNQRHQVVAG